MVSFNEWHISWLVFIEDWYSYISNWFKVFLMTNICYKFQVLNGMSKIEAKIFSKHLGEFYPYFTKLICSEQVVYMFKKLFSVFTMHMKMLCLWVSHDVMMYMGAKVCISWCYSCMCYTCMDVCVFVYACAYVCMYLWLMHERAQFWWQVEVRRALSELFKLQLISNLP